MPHDTVLDWNFEQWAEAAAWFGRVYGWMPFPTLEGAVRVWEGWVNRRLDQPGPSRIVLAGYRGFDAPELERNRVWARKLWWNARNAMRYAKPVPLPVPIGFRGR